MARYIDNNSQIVFNNVSEPGTTSGAIIAKGDYTIDSNDNITKLPKPFVNVVDIDWNGAKPGIGEDLTKGITTTGELLSRIKEVYSPMFAN